MAKKEIVESTEDVMKQLSDAYPNDPGAMKIILPRIEMYSQDKFEGKGKAAKLIKEAGMFAISEQTEEVDEDTGKKVWESTEIGTKMEGIILYQRKQLRSYNESTEQYTSSPVYDKDDEILPLFCEKKEVARGTPAELKKNYEYKDKEGKLKSKLEDNRILYILYKDKIYQMNLRGSSMWSFRSYARTIVPNTVVTKFSSESKEKGTIAWNQMTFAIARDLDAEELRDVLKKVQQLQNSIALEKQQYEAIKPVGESQADKELDMIADASSKL